MLQFWRLGKVQDHGTDRAGVWWEPAALLMAIFSLYTYTEGGASWLALWDLVVRALMPALKAVPSWPNQLPKAPPSNTITLAVRIPISEFCRDADIQIIAGLSNPELASSNYCKGHGAGATCSNSLVSEYWPSVFSVCSSIFSSVEIRVVSRFFYYKVLLWAFI